MQITLTLTLSYDAENELLDHEVQSVTEELWAEITESVEIPKEFTSSGGVTVRLESAEPYTELIV